MAEVVRRLYDSPHTLGETAEACGFCNQFHFAHKFKKIMGISPRVFRQRLFKRPR